MYNMQQFFPLLLSLIQAYMFREVNSPILRSSFWLYMQHLVQCTDTAAVQCIVPKAVYRVKKSSWGWVNLPPETCRPELKRVIKEKVVESCWLLTSYHQKTVSLNLCIQYSHINPYPTAFPYGNGMVLHFYQQQESSTTKTVHKVINKGLKAYV